MILKNVDDILIVISVQYVQEKIYQMQAVSSSLLRINALWQRNDMNMQKKFIIKRIILMSETIRITLII